MFNWIKNKLKAAQQSLKDGLSSPWRWLLVPALIAGSGVIAGFGGFVVPSAAVISGLATAVGGLMVLELRYKNIQEEERYRRDMTQRAKKNVIKSAYEEEIKFLNERLRLAENRISHLEKGEQDLSNKINQVADENNKRDAENTEIINDIQTKLALTQSSEESTDSMTPN